MSTQVFPAFVQYLKTGSDEKKDELIAQLKALDEYLAANGPFLGKETPCAADMSLIPKLYHMKVALKHYRVRQKKKSRSFGNDVNVSFASKQPATDVFMTIALLCFLICASLYRTLKSLTNCPT